MASNPVDSLSFSGIALCGLSFGLFRFRSIDAMCLFVGAVGGWAVFTRLPVGVSALPGVGVITCVALGLCLGAIVVTVARARAASQLVRVFGRPSGDGSGLPLGDQILAAALQSNGLSPERCGPGDLRKSLQGAVEAFQARARSLSMPAALAAFVVPVLTLVDAWLAVQRGSAGNPAVGAAAVPMVIGILSSLVVVASVEGFVHAVRRTVVAWAEGVDARSVSRVGGEGPWEPPSTDGRGRDGVTSGRPAQELAPPSSMSSEEFKELLK
jgi:hypothetical protein